jgi:hypothetical protein
MKEKQNEIEVIQKRDCEAATKKKMLSPSFSFCFCNLVRITDPHVLFNPRIKPGIPQGWMASFFYFSCLQKLTFDTTKNEKPVSSKMKRVFFVTSSGFKPETFRAVI